MNLTPSGALTRASLLACASLCTIVPAHAAKTWTGTTDANWATITNWLEGALPATTEPVVFNASSTSNLGAIALGANRTVSGIQLNNPVSNVTIAAGSTLNLNGGGIIMSPATASFTCNAGLNLLNGDQSFTVASPQSITLANLTRTTGGGVGNLNVSSALNIPSGGGTVKVGAAATAVILDAHNNPWVTYGTNNFAGLDASGFVIPVVPTDWTASIAANFFAVPYVVKADFTQTGNGGVQGIVFNDTTTAYTLSLASSTTFTGRAVLMTSDCVGGTITGGSFRPNRVASGATTNAPMNFIQNSLIGDLRISNLSNASSSTTVSLVKSGVGKMILTGATFHTGGTFINNGTLQVGEGGTTGGLGSTSMVVTQPGTALVVNLSADTALNAPLSGSGSLSQVGMGTTTLGGASAAYTGSVTINGGAIAATSAANLGSGTSLGIDGGKLKFLGAFDPTAARTITIGSSGATFDTNGNATSFASSFASGSTGSVTKEGAGALTLAATNDYSGTTTVNTGTLLVSNLGGSATGSGAVTVNTGATIGGTGSIAGAVSVASGAKVTPGASVGTLTVGQLALDSGATLDLEFNTTPANDRIAVTSAGGLTISGGSINLYQEGTTNAFATTGTYNLIAYSGSINGNLSSLSVANPQPGFGYTFGTSGGFVTLTIGTVGVVRDWQVNGGGTWANNANWNGSFPNSIGAIANFHVNLGAPATVTLDGSKTVGGITFQSNGTNGFTIAPGSGGSLILNTSSGNSSILDGLGNHTISVPVTMTSNTILDTAAATDSITLSGVVSGGGTLTKTGAGSLSLLASNAFTNTLTVSAGTVSFVNGGLGTGSLSLSDSKLVWESGNSQDISNRTITLAGNVTLDLGINDVTLANPIGNSGNADIVKAGDGKLTVAGDTTSTGLTTVSAGILQLGTGGTSGSVSGDIINNGALIVNRSDTYALGGTITGTGSLSHTGTGTLELGGTNTFSGGTTITNAAGSLKLLSSLALQNSTLSYSTSGGTLNFDIQTATTLGALEGDKDIVLTNNDLTPAAVALTIGGNNATTTYTGKLTGLGSLTKAGSGALTLTNDNNYAGGTSLSGVTFPAINTLELPAGGKITTAGVNTGTSTLLLVDGGQLTSSAQATIDNRGFSQVSGFQLTSGSAAFNGGIRTSTTSDGCLIWVAGGNFTASNVTLQRTRNYNALADGPSSNATTYAEIDAAIVDGFVVSDGTADISGALVIGTSNSGASAHFTGGATTVQGEVTIGNTTNTRWSMIQVAGGSFTSTDATSGILLSPHATTANRSMLKLTGGVSSAQRIGFGTATAAAGTGVVWLKGGTLYLGSGGMVQAAPAFTSSLHLTSGVLGASADWSASLATTLDGTITIKSADIADVAHNIDLAGTMTGTGSLEKDGAGSLTLSGTYSYSGSTTVFAGTLALNTGTLSDTGVVDVSTAATLNLNFAGTDTVAGFSIDGAPQSDGTWGAIGSGAQHETARITGSGKLVVPPSDPFPSWISGFPAVGAFATKTDDPDGDGLTNLDEFALDGNPGSGAATGKVRSRIEAVGAEQALVITLPVRNGASFTGTTSQAATIDKVLYTIGGSNNLSLFDQGVTEITASSAGMPALNTGWSYRTFRLNGAIGGVTPRGPKGFLRATASAAP
jgi:fibronectin-binding autotransporter adhesin